MPDVVEAFTRRGFNYVDKTEGGWFRFHGYMKPPGKQECFRCAIELDPEFIDLPRIKLLEIPQAFGAAAPHVGPSGELCYLSNSATVLDIFDPVGQFLACLSRAAYLLGQILDGELIDDLEEEFFAYWHGLFCFADTQSKQYGEAFSRVSKINNKKFYFITDDIERTEQKVRALGSELRDYGTPIYRVKTRIEPRPLTSDWPPKNVRDVLKWQSLLDPACSRNVKKRINEGWRKGANLALILIESPLLTYGIAVHYDRENKTNQRKVARRLLLESRITPLSIFRIDDRYLAERNIPGLKTHAGKNVVVVGCGTIGGYLLEMLAKAGAGTGGGTLTIVDSDLLLPNNIGRHRLGFSYLLRYKAEAMAAELGLISPGTKVVPLSKDIRQTRLNEIDLLIDATGEEALGHWICDNYKRPSPMLSIWIEGPGTTVRGLFRDGVTGACYRCLWHSNRKEQLRSTVQPLPTHLAGQGCEGLYVPFPASVSMQAASLGAEMALDWLNDANGPALRTRLIDQTQTLATPDCDPLPDPECPICHS